MPTLIISEFNIVCTILGGFVLIFGLVSFFVKERLVRPQANVPFYVICPKIHKKLAYTRVTNSHDALVIAVLVGIALGPHGANLIRPLSYARDNSEESLDAINLAFSRLVLGVQLVLAGVQLPKKYLIYEWKSLGLLLGPVMTIMWLVSGTVVYGIIPGLTYKQGVIVIMYNRIATFINPVSPLQQVQALAIGACITPTDPILSNTIVKGKFADKHIPVPLQRIIIAESGANDGLGYPFLFLALYIYRYAILDTQVGHGVSLFFTETMLYTILLSVAYGTVVGWMAKELLHWASEKKLVDRESFLVFAIALALFIVGSCGMIGTDDVLACFIAGNVFTLDDWFRLETLDDSLQPTIDMLLNITIFLWFGAVAPWAEFGNTPSIPVGRLIAMALLVLVLRRPPIILLLYKYIPRIENLKEAAFAGYFGPIGVSAIFYLYVTLEFLREAETLPLSDHDLEGVKTMMTATRLVIWFAVMASVVVHGVTVPVIKLGNQIPMSISRSVSRVTDNIIPGLGGLISRTPSRMRNSVSTLSVGGGPSEDRHVVPADISAPLPSIPNPVFNVDVERGGKSLAWDDDNLERGRDRMERATAEDQTLPRM
ncbi:hypothetical protein Dda_2285 [Drechslerella dactyloides]|uniref:Cation/H+ exchanger transmembrane domain-containing protein n=1 Tax=Drechslerella dactyloides TaxID=74499 RepID=A0AAD6J5L5_DREDA|nr:hypothetical protein Dda_2285 [Drechslerella dactyloides]